MVDLLNLREAAGLSQEELGRKLGISRQAVSQIETGKNTPKVSTAKKLGEILGFDWTEMFNDKVRG